MVGSAIATGVINLVLFGLLVAFCRLVRRENLCSFRLRGDAGGRRLFLKGAMAGLVSFAAYPFIVILFGQGHFDSNSDGLRVTIACTVWWGVGFLPVALFEEALFRGYLLHESMTRFPQWVAVALTSLLFGVFHAFSYGSGSSVWLGALNACLFGVVMSLMVIRSRSLMGAVGLHWAWNLAQEIFLLRPYEGIEALFSLQVRDGLWTGAHLSPETGLIETVIVVLLGASVVLWPGRAGPVGSGRSAPKDFAGEANVKQGDR